MLDGDGRTFDEIAAEREVAKAEAAGAAGPDKRNIIRQQISAARAKIGSGYVSRMAAQMEPGDDRRQASEKGEEVDRWQLFGRLWPAAEATRFKPGHSGNPKGRPKGSKNFSTHF